MKRRVNIWTNLDWITIAIFLILVLMGWLNIYAATYSEQHQSIFDLSMRYGKQMVWIIAAIVMAIIVMIFDIRFYTFFAYVVYVIAIAILAAVLVFGKEVNGARSWFEFAGFHLQPSEFVKVATVLAISKYLSSYNVKIENTKSLIIIGFLIMLPCLLIMAQPDFGSVIVFFALVFPLYREGFPGEVLFFFFLLVILFVLALLLSQHALLIIILALGFAGLAIGARRHKEALIGAAALVVFYFLFVAINKWFRLGFHQYAILLLSSGIVALALLIYSFVRWIRSIAVVIIMVVMAFALTFSVDYVFDHFLAPHQQTRINILLGKESDLKGAEYNVNQSKIAIGSGGFAGKGYLQGTQTKFNFVPEQSTDFIFCTVGEEWGFVGSFLVLLLFGGLLLRLIMMAERQRSVFSRIYGYSVVSILFFHVSINVGMTIGLLPVIGIPLPFFSYGGSSLWAFTILLFIFIRLDASRLELLR